MHLIITLMSSSYSAVFWFSLSSLSYNNEEKLVFNLYARRSWKLKEEEFLEQFFPDFFFEPSFFYLKIWTKNKKNITVPLLVLYIYWYMDTESGRNADFSIRSLSQQLDIKFSLIFFLAYACGFKWKSKKCPLRIVELKTKTRLTPNRRSQTHLALVSQGWRLISSPCPSQNCPNRTRRDENNLSKIGKGYILISGLAAKPGTR